MIFETLSVIFETLPVIFETLSVIFKTLSVIFKTLSVIFETLSVIFTPLKIINADFSNRVASKARSRSYAPVQIHKDLHHYVPQNQLIDRSGAP